MRFGYFIVEGPHDQEFVGRFETRLEYRYSNVRPAPTKEKPWGRLSGGLGQKRALGGWFCGAGQKKEYRRTK